MSTDQKHDPPIRSALVLGAIGVVFGDIGTSPLYTLQECLSGKHGAAPNHDNVLGVVSLIIWAVTMVVTVKYLSFLMRADNQGEGGIMALLALVPPKLRAARGGRVGWVALFVIVGAALLFGDGIITPAISVLSAVEGLEVATTRLHPVVVPATVVILFLLFLIQKRGTGGLGALFGPVMIVWFVVIGALGTAQIIKRPEIFTAFSPVWGARFFIHNGWHGFRVLGGVVLGVTGGEALYADMGHFGRKSIRTAWLALIYPALLLCYMGQGALMLGSPAAAAQPFYSLVPQGFWIYPMVALAALATIIASQALISGVFSLTHQAIRLGYFPRLTVRHTSGEAEGQIYLPLMNWFLALACVALVLVFRESNKLAAAFGLAVSGTMLITSIIYFVVTRETWKWPLWKSLALLLLFLSFDLPFLGANALKFLDGGYLPFFVGLVFVVIMWIWRRGRVLATEHFERLSQPVADFLTTLDGKLKGRVPGMAAFLSPDTGGIPASMQRLVDRFHVLHEEALILNVINDHVPYVPAADRSQIENIGNGLSRVILKYGFMDTPDLPRDLDAALKGTAVAWQAGRAPAPDALVYVLGHETYAATERNHMGVVAETVFAFLSRNSRNATDYFGIPPDQVIELGVHVDL